MKSFYRLMMLAVASLTAVNAETEKAPPPCEKSTATIFARQNTKINMIRDTFADNQSFRMYNVYNTPTKTKTEAPLLRADNYYEGGRNAEPSMGTITSAGTDDVYMKVDLGNKVQYWKIKAHSTCLTVFPLGYTIWSIESVTAAINKE